MTPLETISLVGNIVTFIQITAELVSKARDIYQSADGAAATTIDLERVTSDLSNLTLGLCPTGAPVVDQALVDLCRKCEATAKELQDALMKLKIPQGTMTKVKAYRKALRSIWSADDIASLEKRLDSYRAELNLRVVVDLRDRFKHLQSCVLDGLDNQQRAIIDAIKQERDLFTLDFQKYAEATSKQHQQTEDAVREEGATTITLIAQRLGILELSFSVMQDDMKQTTVERYTDLKVAMTKLENALGQTRNEIAAKHIEYAKVVGESGRAKTSKQKRSVTEKAKAISAAILAWKEIYREQEGRIASLEVDLRKHQTYNDPAFHQIPGTHEQWNDNNTIRFIDVFDRRLRIPYEWCSTYNDFCTLLQVVYREIPGRWINYKLFDIFDEENGASVVKPWAWEETISPGKAISMSIRLSTELRELFPRCEQCPTCPTVHRGKVPQKSGRIRWSVPPR